MEARPGPLLAVLLLIVVYILVMARGGGGDGGAEGGERGERGEEHPLIAEDKLEHRNPHPYRYTLNPGQDVCPLGEQVEVLVLVASGLGHWERRRAVRETWGRRQQGVRLLFLLGSQREDMVEEGIEQEIGEEWEQYGDIVREDFVDSYKNLTLKTLGGMKWAAIYCPAAQWVMKTDDDMYVNLPLLREHLNKEHPHPSRLITGCVKNGPHGAPQPIGQNGASFLPVHPPFTAGAGYLVSGDLPHLLYRASRQIRIIKVEDAFLTGYCARKVGQVTTLHHGAFSCGEMVPRDCDMASRFTGHKVTPERMVAIAGALRRGEC